MVVTVVCIGSPPVFCDGKMDGNKLPDNKKLSLAPHANEGLFLCFFSTRAFFGPTVSMLFCF